MKNQDFTQFNLPDSPGVYYFKKGKDILYVGKATSLRDRARSYFGPDLVNTRGQHLVNMVDEADTIEFKQTPSVLEALILEVFEIKKYQPPYNSQEKDDKSYNYVVITDEKFPRILIARGRSLQHDSKLKTKTYKQKATFGPFPNGGQLKEALKTVRKIFPYRDRCIPFEEQLNYAPSRLVSRDTKFVSSTKSMGQTRACFNRQIGLCPGVCTGEVSAKEYAKIIRNIELFFNGRTEKVKKNLEMEMKGYARTREFEKAEAVKRTLFALDHIRDVSLIKSDNLYHSALDSVRSASVQHSFRIEAYDIAHLSGTATVGVMIVMENGEFNKNEYRKFKIRAEGKKVTVDDTKNLAEVLVRRLGHAEWALPNLIVIDGGVAQMNQARATLTERGFGIDIVSVVKDERHKARELIGKKKIILQHEKKIIQINQEAHRFAIAYHRNLRTKNMFGKRGRK